MPMKKIHESNDISELDLLKSVLEQAGILCEIQNAYLSSLAGAVPFGDCAASLWIVDDGDLPRAEALLAEARTPDENPALPWICPDCDETVDAELAVCWNCGASAP